MIRSLRIGLVPLAFALAGRVSAEDQAATAQPPGDEATLRADNKQLSDELAAAWKESEKLKGDLAAAQAASAKSAGDNADLQRQLDAAKAQPAPAPAAGDTATAGQLSDAQDKLATALRSFTVVQDENAQLSASLDKANSDIASLNVQLGAARSTITTLQAQAALTSQLEPLRAELRQSQDEVSRLALENDQLRVRLSMQSPVPGSGKPAPMRPEQVPAAAPAPAQPAAAPAPAAERTYVVVEGDTLTKISRKFYGTSGKWQDILNANRGTVKDENSLVVGSTLKIP
jgi:nucleoid-associated protein YgaU